jgi:6-phosphogluconolactonase
VGFAGEFQPRGTIVTAATAHRFIRRIMGGHRKMDKKSVNSALPVISRRLVLAAGALGVANLVLPVAAGRAAGAFGPMFVYVGSYTKNPPGGGSNNPVGLSVFGFDPATGALSAVQEVQSANPSFVALDPSRRFLYVINEIDDYEGQKSGSAEA